MSTIIPRRPHRNRYDDTARLTNETRPPEPDLLRDAIKWQADYDKGYAIGTAIDWVFVKPFQLAMIPFKMIGWFFSNINALMILSLYILTALFVVLIIYLEWFA